MLKKIDLWLKMFIIIMFGIALIYVIVNSIINSFTGENKTNSINIEKLTEYVQIYSDEGLSKGKQMIRVTNYTEYHTVKTAVDNYMTFLIDKKYDQVYSLFTTNVKKEYDKKEFQEKMRKIINNNFSMESTEVIIESNVTRDIFKINQANYICEIIKDDVLFLLGIRLDTDGNTYKVFYIDFKE
ncbi:MAG: NTF2-like N-terminal transpeptidase domain-containing protein [Clostridia bacterium]|nr:NTF2-like N-terminal transpeptidase domain-containing protein [Clostridia bacterium]